MMSNAMSAWSQEIIVTKPSPSQTSASALAAGLMTMVVPKAANSLLVTAYLDKIYMAHRERWALDLYGDRLIRLAVADEATMIAEGTAEGAIQLSALEAKNFLSQTINMTGIVEADTLQTDKGVIELKQADATINTSKDASSGFRHMAMPDTGRALLICTELSTLSVTLRTRITTLTKGNSDTCPYLYISHKNGKYRCPPIYVS